MKFIIFLSFFAFSLSSFSKESACRSQVLGHYKKIYHDTYKKASNTFMSNFVGKKNTRAHMLGYPHIAFLGLTTTIPNYEAEKILKKTGASGDEFLAFYQGILNSGELCRDLKEDYKSFAKMKKYLISKYDEEMMIKLKSIFNSDREVSKEIPSEKEESIQDESSKVKGE